jgi:hypothetical protein
MAVGRRFDPADHRRGDRHAAFTFDTAGTPMLIDSDGTVFVPGTRVTDVVLDDATVIVAGGIVQGGSGPYDRDDRLLRPRRGSVPVSGCSVRGAGSELSAGAEQPHPGSYG